MSTPVKLRSITDAEGQALVRVIRRSRDPIAQRRATCVLSAATGMKVPQIARNQLIDESLVRRILHAFNEQGLASLGNRYGKGRPKKFDERTRKKIVDTVCTPPYQLKQPFSVWSLPKLRDYLMKKRIVPSVAIETLRRLLHEEGVSLQHTKTWKQSTDPHYVAKKKRSSVATGRRKRSTGG
jgi:transposase